MSYRIEYGTAIPPKFCRKKTKTHIRKLTAMGILMFALIVNTFWPEGRTLLQNFMLPGNPSVTERAFSDMISELTHGIPMEEAMVAFCQKIIDHEIGASD